MWIPNKHIAPNSILASASEEPNTRHISGAHHMNHKHSKIIIVILPLTKTRVKLLASFQHDPLQWYWDLNFLIELQELLNLVLALFVSLLFLSSSLPLPPFFTYIHTDTHTERFINSKLWQTSMCQALNYILRMRIIQPALHFNWPQPGTKVRVGLNCPQ